MSNFRMSRNTAYPERHGIRGVPHHLAVHAANGAHHTTEKTLSRLQHMHLGTKKTGTRPQRNARITRHGTAHSVSTCVWFAHRTSHVHGHCTSVCRDPFDSNHALCTDDCLEVDDLDLTDLTPEEAEEEIDACNEQMSARACDAYDAWVVVSQPLSNKDTWKHQALQLEHNPHGIIGLEWPENTTVLGPELADAAQIPHPTYTESLICQRDYIFTNDNSSQTSWWTAIRDAWKEPESRVPYLSLKLNAAKLLRMLHPHASKVRHETDINGVVRDGQLYHVLPMEINLVNHSQNLPGLWKLEVVSALPNEVAGDIQERVWENSHVFQYVEQEGSHHQHQLANSVQRGTVAVIGGNLGQRSVPLYRKPARMCRVQQLCLWGNVDFDAEARRIRDTTPYPTLQIEREDQRGYCVSPLAYFYVHYYLKNPENLLELTGSGTASTNSPKQVVEAFEALPETRDISEAYEAYGIGSVTVNGSRLLEAWDTFRREIEADQRLMSIRNGIEVRLTPIQGMQSLYESLDAVAAKSGGSVEALGTPLDCYLQPDDRKYLPYFQPFDPTIVVEMKFCDLTIQNGSKFWSLSAPANTELNGIDEEDQEQHDTHEVNRIQRNKSKGNHKHHK